jgi:hypothetical protein
MENSQITAALARIEAKQDGFNTQMDDLKERLFNGGTGVIPTVQKDVDQLKTRMDSKDRADGMRNIIHYATVPFITVLHGLLRHFGIQV